MKTLAHARREPQEPARLIQWCQDAITYIHRCPTAPSELPERKTLTLALALRGAGASFEEAEHILSRARRGITGPVPTAAKTRELVDRAYEPDGVEWRGLLLSVGMGSAQ